MIVTKLEEYGKKKKKVYIDDSYIFWLYRSELNTYDIYEGSEITEEKLAAVYKETILIRVKKYALSILERMDRSEHELRIKLKQSGYTDELIDEAILYVKKYSYIDDYRYAVNFIKNHMLAKSKNYIQNKLMQKGIDKSMIKDAFATLEDDVKENGNISPEIAALKKEISKRTRNFTEFTLKDKQKLFASLCRKGFKYEMIQRELSLLGMSVDRMDEQE